MCNQSNLHCEKCGHRERLEDTNLTLFRTFYFFNNWTSVICNEKCPRCTVCIWFALDVSLQASREREKERLNSGGCPWLWKNLAAWRQFARDILFLSPLSLFLSVSMLSAWQAQLRRLEGSVPALQSHLLWQYLASLVTHIRTHARAHRHTDFNVHAHSRKFTRKLP